MNRRQFIANGLAAAAFPWNGSRGLCRTTKETPARPNILLFVVDDMGWGDLGCHGGVNRTPVIDNLVKSGVELEQHYVCPQCSPTRLSLLTGRYASRFGVTGATNDPTMPLGTPTLASELKAGGYRTALTGKWHLGSDFGHGPNRYGFDHSYGNMAGACHPWDHTYRPGPWEKTWHRNGVRLDEAGHTTDLIAREAVRWLDGLADGPWFLYVPFMAVHLPVDAPKAWIDLYKDVKFDADPKIDESKRRYAGMVTQMDDAVGKIIAAVERKGQLDRTLIVFLSDNGSFPIPKGGGQEYGGRPPLVSYATGSNGPLRGEKSTTYEGGIRVPAFISWKGRLGPGKIAAPTAAVDWMPTLLDFANGKPGGARNAGGPGSREPSAYPLRDGLDLRPLLAGNAPRSAPRTIYTRYDDGMNALRDGDWKLVTLGTTDFARLQMPGDDRSPQLFNIAQDPFEKTNLAARRPDILDRMVKALADEAAKDDKEKRLIWGPGGRR